MARALVVLGAVLLLSGCGAPTDRGGRDGGAADVPGGASDESIGGAAEHGPVPHPDDTSERHDMSVERVLEWEGYRRVSPSALRFTTWQGDPACYGVRTVVEETADEVRVAIVEGTLPEAPSECTMVAAQARLLVTLQAPLGGRDVVPLDAGRVDLAP